MTEGWGFKLVKNSVTYFMDAPLLVDRVGRRMNEATGDPRESIHLFQRQSVCTQRFTPWHLEALLNSSITSKKNSKHDFLHLRDKNNMNNSEVLTLIFRELLLPCLLP